jgi:hypothetical protein
MDGERLHPRKMHEINPIIKEVNKEEENKESRDKIINVKNTFFTKFLWNTTATNEIQNPQTINISTRNPQTINISTRNPQIINQDETPENQDETPENQDETPENQDNNESLYDMFIPSFRIKDEFDNDVDDIYDNDINNNNNNNNKNQEIEYNDTYNEIVIRIPKQRLNYIKSNTYERWSKQQSKKRDKKDDKVKKWKSNQINKQRIFLETEYLEKYYEDITLIISPNKTITLDAFSKRKIIKKQDKQDPRTKSKDPRTKSKDPRTNQSNEYKTHDKKYYKKMPMNIRMIKDEKKDEIKYQNKNDEIINISQRYNCQILEKREQEKRDEVGVGVGVGVGDGDEKRDDGLGDGDDGLGDGDNENPEKITFVLQSDYPETPPHLYVNDIPYVNVINCCKLSRIKEAVKKYTNAYRPYANCISCGSILTQVNWSTKIRFSNILAENIKIKKMKRIIKYDIAITEIAEIYELDYGIFVQIMSYLTV